MNYQCTVKSTALAITCLYCRIMYFYTSLYDVMLNHFWSFHSVPLLFPWSLWHAVEIFLHNLFHLSNHLCLKDFIAESGNEFFTTIYNFSSLVASRKVCYKLEEWDKNQQIDLIVHGNIDHTLVNSLHGLLNLWRLIGLSCYYNREPILCLWINM